MKAFIFGGNGYLGKHLAYFLIKNDYDVIVFDQGERFSENLGVEYCKFDINNINDVKNIHYDCDLLFYFVGLTGTEDSFLNYKKFKDINEIGLLNLLEHFKKLVNPPKIIFPSTRLVYKGKDNFPITENCEKEFKTIYAISKYNGEQYLKMYRNLYNINYTIFRICVPYGNIFNNKFSYGTIGFFLNSAMINNKISLYGNGSLKRTFTHVLDICKQILQVSLLDKSSGECYNVLGETFSLNEIAGIISKQLNVKVEYLDWPEIAEKLESGDTIFDATKISSEYIIKLEYNLSKWLINNNNES